MHLETGIPNKEAPNPFHNPIMSMSNTIVELVYNLLKKSSPLEMPQNMCKRKKNKYLVSHIRETRSRWGSMFLVVDISICHKIASSNPALFSDQ